jgi:hypothetical protein
LAVAWDLCRFAPERKLELLTYKGFAWRNHRFTSFLQMASV